MHRARALVAKRCAWLALVAALAGVDPAPAQAPRRVVSMNLCTDQLALLLAAPGQILSVSKLARDPHLSNLATEAEALPANWGRAEEILLLEPDLVLAGSFTTRSTVDLLRRLGFRVEEFAPDHSFEDIRASLLRMGRLLGREPQARAILAAMETELDRIKAHGARQAQRPRAVAYYAGGRTAGAGSLMDAVMQAAGLANVAAEQGSRGLAIMPMEQLVLAAPERLIGGVADARGAALAHQNYRHPAIKAVAARGGGMESLDDRLTICGGPFTLAAVLRLAGPMAAQGAAP